MINEENKQQSINEFIIKFDIDKSNYKIIEEYYNMFLDIKKYIF